MAKTRRFSPFQVLLGKAILKSNNLELYLMLSKGYILCSEIIPFLEWYTFIFTIPSHVDILYFHQSRGRLDAY